jgi:dipeptidyl aminopeptidase/acylaminoacyl peptidase
LILGIQAAGQDKVVTPPDSIVADDVPKIPIAIAEKLGRYGEYRFAQPLSWHPGRRELLISTRFGDTLQLHLVKQPGGARQQLTFSSEPIQTGSFQPQGGDYILFQKDVGGGEWYQLFRYDMATGESVLLTDGKSRNIVGPWSSSGDRIAYTSTRRTGKDTDLWTMNPANPKTDRLLSELSGGGWEPLDWSADDKTMLVKENVSATEAHLWAVNAETGEKRPLAAPKVGDRVAYGKALFSRSGNGIYFTSDKGSEFQRLTYMDLITQQTDILTPQLNWDVEDFALTKDGTRIAFITNEEGTSVVHVLDTRTKKVLPLPKLPVGLVTGLIWHKNGRDLAFMIASASSPGDVYSIDVTSQRLERWTFSETAIKTSSFPEPELVRWKSFDGRMISGFLYMPPPRFKGKRPVMIVLHGGPESQSRPVFLGPGAYDLNENGVAIIFPNFRGSTGYGKTFTDLDNGFRREDSYKDIGALFNWIDARPELDPSRVAVIGGSYGGHLALVVSTFYAAQIRCAVDVVGMSNLVTFLENTEAYRRDLRRVEYGDERDPKMRGFLEGIAPMNNLGKIQKPLLVVAGKNDPRVPITESDQIVSALKKQGTPVWYIMATDEGHGFAKKGNSDYMYDAIEEFFDEYLLK